MPRKEWKIEQYHMSLASARREINARIKNFRDQDFFGMQIKSIKLSKRDPFGGPNKFVKPKGTKGKGRRLYDIVLVPRKKPKRKRRKG